MDVEALRRQAAVRSLRVCSAHFVDNDFFKLSTVVHESNSTYGRQEKVVLEPELQFFDVVASLPGSVHDSEIFTNSRTRSSLLLAAGTNQYLLAAMVMHADADSQCNLKAVVAVKSTWFFTVGMSKSTQAGVLQWGVSRSTQWEDPTDYHITPLLVEQPSPKKVESLAPRNSKSSTSEMQQDAKPATAADHIFHASRSKDGHSPIVVVAGSAIVTYACGCCFLQFHDLSGLTCHVQTCSWPKPYYCSLCSQPCADWSATRAHLATHVEKMPRTCPFCEYTLDGSHSLAMRHVLRHVDVKQFMCNICKSAFINGKDLLSHIQRCHLNERTYKCDSCSISFADKRTLQVHVRRHAGERPYKCNVCSATFAKSSAAASHMRCHKKGTPYCAVCSRMFATWCTYFTHVRCKHGSCDGNP
ncbi:zinc finger protein 660-like isoform X4 [Dermacentor albipictus]|uniref:zinc finger protein 660-like isoform X4 n=1 Tax=Dermacentor albipictus TaxID=60249 RepID=UPI0038FD3F3F